jgi:hypothetical protein
MMEVIQKILDLPSRINPNSNIDVGFPGQRSLALRKRIELRITYAEAKILMMIAR